MTPIDWTEVEAACRRGRQGRMTLADQLLVSIAFKADPTRYREVHTRARDDVDRELTSIWQRAENRDDKT